MCRLLEKNFRETKDSSFNSTKFEELVRDSRTRNNPSEYFEKQISKSKNFTRAREEAPLPQLGHRLYSEMPGSTPTFVSRHSEDDTMHRRTKRTFSKRLSKAEKGDRPQTEEKRTYK